MKITKLQIRKLVREAMQSSASGAAWKLIDKASNVVVVHKQMKSLKLICSMEVYVPGSAAPTDFRKRIGAVVLVKPTSPDFNSEVYWGGSGYIGDAAKKTFRGLPGTRLLSSFEYKDLGMPVGKPHDRANENPPVFVLVFGK